MNNTDTQYYLSLPDGSEKLSDNSPGAASISSVDIANEFAGLSSEEQDRVRAEWSQVNKALDSITIAK